MIHLRKFFAVRERVPAALFSLAKENSCQPPPPPATFAVSFCRTRELTGPADLAAKFIGRGSPRPQFRSRDGVPQQSVSFGHYAVNGVARGPRLNKGGPWGKGVKRNWKNYEATGATFTTCGITGEREGNGKRDNVAVRGLKRRWEYVCLGRRRRANEWV